VDRGIEADFEVEALGRDPGRKQEKRLICWPWPTDFREMLSAARLREEKEDEVHQ
jgi:hypothetical protein